MDDRVYAVGEYTLGPVVFAIVIWAIQTVTSALIDIVDRERGEVTHQLMARDLESPPLAAEIILRAPTRRLRTRRYRGVESVGRGRCPRLR